MTTHRPRGPRWAAVLALALAAGGCGAKTGEVSGTVTLKGRPPNIDGLIVNFLGPDGQPVSAPVARDGTYRVSGLAEGEYRVGLSAPRQNPAQTLVEKPQPGQPAPPPKSAGPVPDEFLDPNRSNLRAAVTAGGTTTLDVSVP